MKITKQEKAEVKDTMEKRGIQVFFFPEYDCTVALRMPSPDSATVHVSIAIKSMDEPKFKKSVGRFLTVRGLEEGRYLPYVTPSNPDDYDSEHIALHIASCFGRIN